MAARAEAIAAVERELAAFQAADTARTLPRRGGSGPSTVYTIRLDREEVKAIRIGLSGRGTNAVTEVVDRLESTMAELRALVP